MMVKKIKNERERGGSGAGGERAKHFYEINVFKTFRKITLHILFIGSI